MKSSNQYNILAIDDTPANLLTLGAALSDEFDLQIVTSGQQGIALATANPPDLILLDIMMPEMDGYAVCRHLKADDKLKDIPVIFVSALDDVHAETHGLTLGASDYITKPINVQIARQRIRNLLEREALRCQVESQRDQLAAQIQTLSQLNTAIEQSPVLVMITDLQGHIEYVNPRFCEVTGFSADEVKGKTPKLLQSGQTAPDVYRSMWNALLAGKTWKGDLCNKRKNGELYWEELQIAPVRNPLGQITHYVAVKTDITQRRQTQELIRHMAQHDTLTGLANRALFADRLQRALASAARDRTMLALMFLDLDKFKPVNDQFGHAVGDSLLQMVTQRMQAGVRDSDTVARIGGDEFVVLLRSVAGGAEACVVAEKIRASLELPFTVGGHSLAISCSIGVAIYPEHGTDATTLSRNADWAMYQSKEHGRNQVTLYQVPPPEPGF